MQDVYALAPVNKLAALVTSQAGVTDDFLLRTIDLHHLYLQCRELLDRDDVTGKLRLRLCILSSRIASHTYKEIKKAQPRLFEGVAVGDKFLATRRDGKYIEDVVCSVGAMHFRGKLTKTTYSIRSGKASSGRSASGKIAVPIVKGEKDGN